MDGSGRAPWIHSRADIEVGPPPAGAPAPLPPPAEFPEPPHRRTVYLVSIPLIVAAAALGFWTLRGRRASDAPAAGGEAIVTATVELRPFVSKLRVTGTVEAVRSTAIFSPRLRGAGGGQMVITRLIANGTRVKKGDFLVEFDRQAQLKDALDKQAQYRDLEDQLQKKVADEQAARAHDETELKRAENDLEKARLEMQRNEIVSRIDAERNRLTLEEDQAQLKQLRETFELKRQAAEAEQKNLATQRDRAHDEMAFAQHNAELMSVHSPIDGLAVLKSIWKGGSMGDVQEGDQVWTGMAFMQVVDTSAMQVSSRVSEVDISSLRPGQPVEVRLDAYPDALFAGKVEQIAALGVASEFGERVRVFPVVFSIQGSDPRLMPDLTAAVDIELDRRERALLAPRDAIVSEGGKSWAWVQSRFGFEKRLVKVTAMNDLDAVVESGLAAGDVIERQPGGGKAKP